ncbi:uncharacterized protein N7479_010907 [Penicillium vulpinum]|uniref:Uncharacterized protein n=1 Tax=Penicillium vulpinum TaxID=29845 RepID=A0A1V6RZW1_9EURO|nr:uncharacterized protein N7479_010907 [Penicillium vulpinum]KAJ5952494.1 hypothetical protein N7479_010907 [Penicillium vulpinum]OQE07327.1 hypothetical protein PENVUL_c014G00608 [Penicillium vulpinum]
MPISFRKEKPIRDHAYIKALGTLKGDKYQWEVDLEQSGDINTLQRYRLIQYGRQVRKDKSAPPFNLHKLLFVEEDLREVVQEEISFKEEHKTLNKDAEERLSALNVKYWLLMQTWVDYRSCLEQGYLQRAFELWRSHPQWYMDRMLVDDCASRQGCCARACGCCLNRSIDPAHTLGVGHCTFECGCCRRARGFEIPEEDKKLLKARRREEMSHFPTHRIIRVTIWGLVGDSYDSPFDMIDAPPTYGQITNGKASVKKRDKTR